MSRVATRAEVTRVFQEAFENAGDVEALSEWAKENRTEFYKLYGRLLPNSSHPELDTDHKIVVEHVIRVNPLGTGASIPRMEEIIEGETLHAQLQHMNDVLEPGETPKKLTRKKKSNAKED